jgi:hypothetical protein
MPIRCFRFPIRGERILVRELVLASLRHALVTRTRFCRLKDVQRQLERHLAPERAFSRLGGRLS